MRAGMNMMQPEQLVIEDTLDHVETSRAESERSHEHLIRQGDVTSPYGAPEKHDSRHHGRPHDRVEDAIPDHIDLGGDEFDGRYHARQHLMPLQDLMKENTVDKAPHADSEEGARRDERPT